MTQDEGGAMQRRVAQAHGLTLSHDDAARMAGQARAAAEVLERLSAELRAEAGEGAFFHIALDAHATAFRAALQQTEGQDG